MVAELGHEHGLDRVVRRDEHALLEQLVLVRDARLDNLGLEGADELLGVAVQLDLHRLLLRVVGVVLALLRWEPDAEHRVLVSELDVEDPWRPSRVLAPGLVLLRWGELERVEVDL